MSVQESTSIQTIEEAVADVRKATRVLIDARRATKAAHEVFLEAQRKQERCSTALMEAEGRLRDVAVGEALNAELQESWMRSA